MRVMIDIARTTLPEARLIARHWSGRQIVRGGGREDNRFTCLPAHLLLNNSLELDANTDGRPDKWTSNARFCACQ